MSSSTPPCVPRLGEPGGICSGRGVCLDVSNATVNSIGVSGVCICETGWSPIGDFATDPSVDCGINVIAVRALWGLCACSNFLLLLLSVYRLWTRRRKLQLQRVDTRVFSGGLVQGVFFTVIGIMQAANDIPGARSVGIDTAVTIMFVIGCLGFFLPFTAYNYSLITVAGNQARMTLNDDNPIHEKYVRLVRNLLPLQIAFSVLASLSPLGFLARNPQNDQLYGSLHYIFCMASILILILQTELVTIPLKRQVQNLRKTGRVDPNIEQAIKILTRTTWELRVNALIQTTINLMMGSVPLLLRKASYQIPLAWFFIAIGGIDVYSKVGATAGSKASSSNAFSSSGRQVAETESPREKAGKGYASSTVVASSSKALGE